MDITRRHLIALTTATAAAGALGVGGVGFRWWNQPAEESFGLLSVEEGAIVRAIAGAAYPRTEAIPLDGSEAGLDRYFDAMLGHVPPITAKLLKFLLHGLDGGTVLTHGATFTSLSRQDQDAVLTTWIHHDLSDLRNAAQSLVLLLGMGWTIHPKVAPYMQQFHSCGYGV